MNRRLFCQFPLVAAAMIAEAKADPSSPNPSRGIKVESHKDRFDEELLIMGGQFDCKVSAKDTGGQLCIYDTYRSEKGGPALHLHYQQDEWFFVIEGEFVIKVGEDLFHLKAGDSAFAPRKVPHTFAKVSDGEAHMLVLLQPAGTIETFFKEMSKLGPSIPKGQEHALRSLFQSHGMQLLGPPLKI
jgi:mannose-6-phosphate isomerase-like protein (cupin superfamily)